MISTDIFSLLHNVNSVDEIEAALINKFGVDISNIIKSFSDSDINTLFNLCYAQVMKAEEKHEGLPSFIQFRQWDLYASPSSITTFQQYLKKHSFIMSLYTLQDYKSQTEFHMMHRTNCSSRIIKDRINSLYNIFPNQFFNMELRKTQSNTRIYGMNYYGRNFLDTFDVACTETHSNKNIPSKFLNPKTIDTAEGKYINKSIRDFFHSLEAYYRNIFEKCLELNSRPLQLCYYYKLESIFGLDFLLSTLLSITEYDLSIEDIAIFQKDPNILYRSNLLFCYKDIETDLSLNDAQYLINHLVPLVVNTFFVLLNKVFENQAYEIMINYFNNALTPPSPTERKEILQKLEFEYKKGLTQLPPDYPSCLIRPFAPLKIHPSEEWICEIACVTSNHQKIQKLSSEASVNDFISATNLKQKKELLKYLTTHYQKANWIIPVSKLP